MSNISNIDDSGHTHEELLNAIIETAIDGIVTINHKGIIEMVNKATCQLFGYEASELIGKNIKILMPQPYRDRHDSYIHNYMLSGKAKIIGIGRDITGISKSGHIFPIRLAVSEFEVQGVKHFTGVIHDLTQAKQAEAQIKKLNTELEAIVELRTKALKKALDEQLEIQKKMELEIKERQRVEQTLQQTQVNLRTSLDKEKEVSELKSRFVSLASHEFRTPLSTILSSASIIHRYVGDCDPKVHKHIQRIKASVNNLNEILNDFLSLSKIENRDIAILKEDFSPALVCKEIVEEMKTQLKPGQTIQLTGDVKHRLYSDRRILKNILINLITNASRYSFENTMILLNLFTTDDHLKIEVVDQGMGIPASDMKHLFTRFFRGSNVEHIKGTGLGLHIVKEFCTLLDAEVQVESKLGKGSTFSIIFKQTK